MNRRRWPVDTNQRPPEEMEQEGRKEANQQQSRIIGNGLTYDEDSIIFSNEGGDSCAARGIPDKVRICDTSVSETKPPALNNHFSRYPHPFPKTPSSDHPGNSRPYKIALLPDA